MAAWLYCCVASFCDAYTVITEESKPMLTYSKQGVLGPFSAQPYMLQRTCCWHHRLDSVAA